MVGEARGELLFDEDSIDHRTEWSLTEGSKANWFKYGLLIFGILFAWFAYIVALSTHPDAWNLWAMAVLLVLMTLLIIVALPKTFIKERRSFVPIRIYEHGIELYASPAEKRRGENYFVPIKDIRAIRVERGETVDRVDAREWWGYHHAPVELAISTRNGIRRTGKKELRTITAIIDVIKKEWGMPIFDDEEGLGSYTRYIKDHGEFKRITR